MSQQFNVAILGATSAVGEAILEVLGERGFPVGEIYLLENEDESTYSRYSFDNTEVSDDDDDGEQIEKSGKNYRINGKTISVTNVNKFDWSQVQIAFFASGEEWSAKWSANAVDEGVVVIDNSAHFRYDYDIPLVVADVNPAAIAEFRNRNIIASPSSATIQMLLALKPIYDEVGVARVNVSTYQSVSTFGKEGIDELAGQTARLLNGLPADAVCFNQQVAFNCLPLIGPLLENGYSKEEIAMVIETQKVLNDSSIAINPTCVIVPVFYGYAESLHIETLAPIDAEQVIRLFEQCDDIEVVAGQDYPTQIQNSDNKDIVKVGRIRNDISHHNGINLWVVADNVRSGAATNLVKIAEILIRDYF